MNNRRLLTGLLVVTLLRGGLCSFGQQIIPLENLFDIAESNSPQLRPSFTAEMEAEHEISIARNGRLPDINASLSLSYIGDGFTTERNFSDYQKAPIPHFGSDLSINISQPLYTGGAIAAKIKLAKLKSTVTRYASELKRDNIRFMLTGFYLDLYKYRNLQVVVEHNIAQARKVLAEMNARHEQGIALLNDITRYELLVSNLELQLIQINNTIDILNQNLVITSGLPESTIILPDSTILSKSLVMAGEKAWQQEAELNSPILKLSQTEIEMNRKTESLVKSERLPKIGLQAGWSINGPILVEVPPINRNLSYWFVGLGFSYNISSIYKNNKDLAKSKIATRKALEQHDAEKADLAMEIKADYIRYIEAYEALKTQQKSVELARQNYTTTSTRYSADMALITDMLDAANSKLDAEQQLVNARINIIYYYYKLLFITGKI